MASTLLRHVRAKLGQEAVDGLLQTAGLDYAPGYLEDVGNWIWYDEAVALFEAAATITAFTRSPGTPTGPPALPTHKSWSRRWRRS